MGWTFYNSSGQQLRNTGTVLATQAEMKAGSVITSFVTPGRTQHHPGVAKAWVSVDADGAGIESGSYNVDSNTDTSTGVGAIVFTTNFSGTTYVGVGCTRGGSTTDNQEIHLRTKAAGNCSYDCVRNGALADEDRHLVFYGDQ